MGPKRFDDDEIPEPPPLDGDDEPLGDAAGVASVDEGDADLDDAPAGFDVPVEFDESEGGGDEREAPLDTGADDEGIVVDDDGAAGDEPGVDRSGTYDLDVPDFGSDTDDRGDEGPLGEPTELGALPPLDDDDDDDEPRPAVARSASARPRRVAVDGVVAMACDGERLLLLAGEVFAVPLDPRAPIDEAVETPDETGRSFAVDGRGGFALATLAGALFVRGASGAWRQALDESAEVRAVGASGASLWAWTRAGATLRSVDGGRFERDVAVSRCAAWAFAPSGAAAVFDAARGALGLRGDDGGGRWAAVPPGVTPTRIALRGEAVALADGVRGSAWVSLDGCATWTAVRAERCRDVAFVGADDGGTRLLVASISASGRAVDVALADCDGDRSGAALVAEVARADDDAPSLELLGIGRGGALCAVAVDGVAYVVSAAAARPRS